MAFSKSDIISATVLFPVPVFPAKLHFKGISPKKFFPFSCNNRAIFTKLWIAAFTLDNPIILSSRAKHSSMVRSSNSSEDMIIFSSVLSGISSCSMVTSDRLSGFPESYIPL